MINILNLSLLNILVRFNLIKKQILKKILSIPIGILQLLFKSTTFAIEIKKTKLKCIQITLDNPQN